jgi:hypothetical protein
MPIIRKGKQRKRIASGRFHCGTSDCKMMRQFSATKVFFDMPRIVFALPFRKNVVSGGQKMIY